VSKRNDLLRKYHAAKNGPEKEAIQAQILALDEAASRENLLLTALEYPLRKTKGLLSGSEEHWFPPETDPNTIKGGTYSHTMREAGVPDLPQEAVQSAYNAAGTVADVVLDPANPLGGMMAKGGQGLKGAVASLDNYIPGHYGARTPQSPDSKLSKEAYLAKEKLTGFAGWATDQVKDTIGHYTNPSSRALYNEQKITRPVQQRIKNRDPSDTRGTEKNVSQIQYTSGHIPTQTGGAPSTNPAAKEVLNRSFVESYAPVEGNSVSDALQRQTVKRYDGQKGKPTAKDFENSPDVATTPEEAMVVQENFNAWFPEAKQFVVKSPVAKETGGHFNDVVYKNPAKAALVDGFKKHIDEAGNVNLDALEGFLKETQGSYNKKLKDAGRKKDGWKVGRKTDEGLYLHGSKVGSAITEGGVGWVAKIEPDGTFKAWMLDNHDFKEKVPGVKAIVPDDMVAVTPTMVTNIKNLAPGKKLTANLRREGQEVRDGRKKVKKDHTGPKYKQTPPNRGQDKTYKGLFEDYVSANPTPKGVATETRRLVGEGLLAQRAYDNLTGETNNEQ
jgi:hypothetical protein